MPFYNNPTSPDPHYKALGWLNSGLSAYRRVVVSKYKKDYAVRNRFSPGRGAIVVHAAFYIHAGPASIYDSGIQQLVNAGKLVVTIQAASPPDIKKSFTRMYP